MNKDEALRMALEALKKSPCTGKYEQDWDVCNAIYACEEALAQPEREWVGLTDEEIFETHKQVDSMQYLTFGKAIEAKLKEKNHE